MLTCREIVQELIRKKLQKLNTRSLTYPFTGTAAVLMPIVETSVGEPAFLLTKRTDSVGTHKGQISFPGGMREGDESLERTALRETEEELGIAAEDIHVLGRFHDFLAITRWRVVPYVGVLAPGLDIRPNPAEVARVLTVPFAFFHETEPRIETRVRLGNQVNLYYYHYQDEVIWGLTAAIIRDFLNLLQR